MFKNIKISVVIATYNGSKYIIEELESIMNQTITPDEVIISDDCSNDNTTELINNFIVNNNLSNWKLNKNKTNKGFSKNFMDTLYSASGDIIFLADQDDIWIDNKIEKMLEVYCSNKNVKSVASEFTFIDGNSNSIEAPKKVPNVKCKLDNSLIKIRPIDNVISSYIRGCTTFVSKDIVDYVKNNNLDKLCSNYLLGHDWLLWMISSLMGNTYILCTPLIKYRFHDLNSSLTALQRKELIGDISKRIEGLEKSIKLHEYIINNKNSYINLNDNTFKFIKKTIKFEKRRLKFLLNKNPLDYLLLIKDLNKYKRYYRDFNRGIKVYIGDLLYAFKKR